jgi:hypothetical protein
MRIQNLYYGSIPGATCTMLCVREKPRLINGAATIGDTQCCGSLEVWGNNENIGVENILEFLVCSNCAILFLHFRNTSSSWDTVSSLPSIETKLNAIAPDIWKVKLQYIEYNETLVVLEILDNEAYLKWREAQNRKYQ